MSKRANQIPKQYLQNVCMAQKVADGTYIQNVVITRPINESWTAVNNVSVK